VPVPRAPVCNTSAMPDASPTALYSTRLAEREALAARLDVQHDRFANARLATVGAVAVVGWAVLGPPRISALWLLLPTAVFAALAVAHARVLRQRESARRAAGFYRRGLARIEGHWHGTGSEGLTHLPDEHPYAADLDLFGHGSLFQLVSSARLGGGEQLLARWLLHAAAPDDVRRRQASVNELRPQVDLRERLALAGDEIVGYLDTTQLAAWGQAPSHLVARWPRFAAAILAATNAVSLGAAFLFDAGTGWFAASALASAAFAVWWRRPVSHVLEAANAPVHQLNLLAEVLEIVEREEGSAPELEAIRRRLIHTGAPASVRIHELRRLMDLLSSRRNQFFAPIAALLLWGTQFAWAIEAWRRRNGPFLADWIDAISEFEALCSLAGYAYEHPDDPFPEIVEGEVMFDGDALAHPLLAAAVPNDVRLDRETRVLVVSGSNMSGKSTLLRTVGVATVLALAGAPVRARRLRLSPLAVGATLRIQDSLQAGRSRFFAELTRLRAIVDATAGPMPVLFLLDELLAGTNSHDRRIGAASLVRGLVERGSIGLVTTHDLALAEVVADLGVHATNVHFSDWFENGEIRFDYRMRPGVVRTSNALELMRAVGLMQSD
jgi:MutS domain V